MAGGLVPYLALAARLLLAAVLLTAAAGKARSFRAFTVPLRGLGVPRPLAAVATSALIAYEAGLGLLLAAGLFPAPTVAAAALLLAAFIAVSMGAVMSGRQVTCNCFGASGSLLGWGTAARAVLMGAALAIYAEAPTFPGRLAWPGAVRSAALVTGLALAMLLAGRWATSAPALARLLRQRRDSQVQLRRLMAAVRPPADDPLTLEEAT